MRGCVGRRWASLVSASLFAVSHSYDGWGLLQVGLMGIGFAIVTIRTGGLEAGIAFHTVNNVGSFALSGTGMFSRMATGMTTETGGPIAVVWQLVTVVIWVGRDRTVRPSTQGRETQPHRGTRTPFGNVAAVRQLNSV